MKSLRFPKKLKLIDEIDFKLSNQRKINHRCLSISYQANKKAHARLGVIVSKRVSKLAVIRNQIKRIIRESFRLNQHKLAGCDIIVIARQQCDKLSKLELRKEIEDLWKKINI